MRRDLQQPRRRQRRRLRARKAEDPRLEVRDRERQRIVVDEERPVGRHDLDEPGQAQAAERHAERADGRVDLGADLVGQLDRERAVAGRQEPWMIVDGHRATARSA